MNPDAEGGKHRKIAVTGIRNLIFDIDGTLVDSKRDIADAQLWVLRQLGFDRFTPEDIFPHIGKPLGEIFRELLPPDVHHRIGEATLMYIQRYRPRALETTTLFPEVKETLEELHRRGFRLAVATTKSTFTTTRVLKHFGVGAYFSQLQGTDGTPTKPDPFIVNKILNDQQWEKTESMMVGDTDKDVLAGKNAGTRTCAVTYGSLTREQLQRLEPDIIIDRFPDILNHVVLP